MKKLVVLLMIVYLLPGCCRYDCEVVRCVVQKKYIDSGPKRSDEYIIVCDTFKQISITYQLYNYLRVGDTVYRDSNCHLTH